MAQDIDISGLRGKTARHPDGMTGEITGGFFVHGLHLIVLEPDGRIRHWRARDLVVQPAQIASIPGTRKRDAICRTCGHFLTNPAGGHCEDEGAHRTEPNSTGSDLEDEIRRDAVKVLEANPGVVTMEALVRLLVAPPDPGCKYEPCQIEFLALGTPERVAFLAWVLKKCPLTMAEFGDEYSMALAGLPTPAPTSPLQEETTAGIRELAEEPVPPQGEHYKQSVSAYRGMTSSAERVRFLAWVTAQYPNSMREFLDKWSHKRPDVLRGH